ncbi:hypothetical protein [Oligella sp. HMSC05A10]|uniref:hypothetical protein n=1 Tax=Oligella sp. HMSC05A10 TaxID=1581112 RepID=UPI00114D30A1|nr:hypothetical protein [Oligella sp. HMSC05A10]
MTLENDTKRPVGRPRKYANQAERQRAYRQRLRDRGLKVVQRIEPIKSPLGPGDYAITPPKCACCDGGQDSAVEVTI